MTHTAPPTIKDVARLAGVSVATVSRALNNPGRVNEDTAAHVRAIAVDLDYIPYRAAGSLVSKRFKAIGALMPTIDNTIFARALHALQGQLNSYGYSLLVASTHYNSEREVLALQSLIEHGVDAIVLVGAQHHPGVDKLMARTSLPFVNTWVYDPDSAEPCIGLDNRGAMFRVASYLLDLGHRDFAFISGITDHNDRAALRKAGALDALTRNGIHLDPERILEKPYTIAAGRAALRALLALPNPPTAIMCGNDILAFGAIYECLAQGIDIPGQISITGFDDFELSSHMQPSLTTVRVPATEMGIAAADYLVSVLERKPVSAHTEFEAELIVRGSTARPPQLFSKPTS